MPLASIVNTRSIASGSGFALLLPAPIETLPSVEVDEISRQFGQFFKQQHQRSVNQFTSMSTGAIPALDIKTQIAAAMMATILAARQVSVLPQANSVLGADPFGVRPTAARTMVKSDAAMVAMALASPHPVLVVNFVSVNTALSFARAGSGERGEVWEERE